MPFRSKQRHLSYSLRGTDSFNKVQRGLCIPGALCITRAPGVRRCPSITRTFIIQVGSARNPPCTTTTVNCGPPPEIIRRKLRRIISE
ncbi:hypothetical protein DBV15_09787 [Temnothorax longispinosus]|uniref:Uncharacterized protein n=1 Tax=Temnothorax longispinosus TaxID=300112 RepID=A0A4S2JSE4_9HYME|nr:hypothetical protein DBV15_09787 [Temnothorax longispinosus]